MSSDRPGGPAETVSGHGMRQGKRPDRGIPPQQGTIDGAAQPVTGGAQPAGGAPSAELPASRFSRRLRRRQREQRKGSLLKELPILLVVAFVLALLVKTFLVQAFFIPSGSMETTLHGCPGCTGDRVLVNKVPYWLGEPEPGEIVVFQGPDTWSPEVDVAEPTNWFSHSVLWLGRAVGVAPPSEDDYIKRVIAVGGQTVQCCDVEGRVTVDGQPLAEPYIFEPTPIETRAFGPVTVPEGRLWMMGDHRSASSDSRSHLADQYAGTVAVDDVVGKAAVIVWPFDRFSLLDTPAIQGVEAAAAPPVTGVASLAVPHALGLAGAVPLSYWRRRRRP